MAFDSGETFGAVHFVQQSRSPFDDLAEARDEVAKACDRLGDLTTRLIGPPKCEVATKPLSPPIASDGLLGEVEENARMLKRSAARIYTAVAAIERHLPEEPLERATAFQARANDPDALRQTWESFRTGIAKG